MKDQCTSLALPPQPALTTTAPTAVTPTQPKPTFPASSARNFTIYDGRDIGGSDYKILKDDMSQDACIEQCKRDDQCVAFAWDRWNNYCFLKNAVPGIARIDPQSMSAVAVGKQQPTDSNAPIVVERFYNAEFRDRPFGTTKDGSYGDCERSCRNDDRCEVFTYRSQNRLCSLIRRPYQYYRLGARGEKHAPNECNSLALPVCSGVRRQAAP
jgi:hypothetical protein